jgi:hypothetical protein
MLKSVSRKRSEVGRVSKDGGLFNLRPRYLPAIIRKVICHQSEPLHGSGFLKTFQNALMLAEPATDVAKFDSTTD